METARPKRKPTRLPGFDYGTKGAYFITICTVEMRCTLSSIEPFPPSGVDLPSPQPCLTQQGAIAEKWIKALPLSRRGLFVDLYVIMPNHIHLLLSLAEDVALTEEQSRQTITAAVGWLKYQITHEINKSSKTKGAPFFQRSFYDHIIRNRKDYEEIYKYIEENPKKWQLDKLYTK